MNYDIVWTTQFKKDYKLALKRHLNIDLLDNIIRRCHAGRRYRKRIKIIPWLATGQDTVSVIFCWTGCWSTVLTMMFWF